MTPEFIARAIASTMASQFGWDVEALTSEALKELKITSETDGVLLRYALRRRLITFLRDEDEEC